MLCQVLQSAEELMERVGRVDSRFKSRGRGGDEIFGTTARTDIVALLHTDVVSVPRSNRRQVAACNAHFFRGALPEFLRLALRQQEPAPGTKTDKPIGEWSM